MSDKCVLVIHEIIDDDCNTQVHKILGPFDWHDFTEAKFRQFNPEYADEDRWFLQETPLASTGFNLPVYSFDEDAWTCQPAV